MSIRPACRGRDERGSVILMVAAMMVVVVGMGALALDIGMQRVARRDMQAVADVVSLDLVRELGTKTNMQLSVMTPSLQTIANAARDRNDDSVGATPTITLRLGAIGSSGQFIPKTLSTDVPTAVEVTASTTVDFAIHAGQGGASRTSIAAVSSFACYKLGSWAAAINTGNSALLNPILRQMAMQSGKFSNGGAVGALTYTGVAQSKVDLNALSTQLGVASVDDLATATVGLKSFYTALALLASPSNATVLNVLNTLSANASNTTTIAMGKLLQANAGSSSMLEATANVLDLVGGSISLLNGVNVANVYLGAALPSLTSAGIAVKLTQGPHQYCGAPSSTSTIGVASQTEQLNVHLGGQLNPSIVNFVPPAISGLLTNVASAFITAENYATFDISVAGTTSKLTGITCGTTQGITLDVTNGLATVTFSTPLRAEVHAKLTTLNGLGLPSIADAVIRINAGVNVSARLGTSGVSALSISIPPKAFDTPYATTSGGVTITSSSRTYGNVSANVELLGGLLGANISLNASQQTQILDSVLSAGLTALFSPTDPHSLTKTVFDPILGLIGARVGGSDAILDSKPALNCATPKLVG